MPDVEDVDRFIINQEDKAIFVKEKVAQFSCFAALRREGTASGKLLQTVGGFQKVKIPERGFFR